MYVTTYIRVCIIISFFFFFKQKTAYEMRISDWSSDVCSSDLHQDDDGDAEQQAPVGELDEQVVQPGEDGRADDGTGERFDAAEQHHEQRVEGARDRHLDREDRAFGEGEEAAGEPRHGAGEDEGDELQAICVDADGRAEIGRA